VITINKGENNQVWLTVAENTTLTDPKYLFVFTSDITHKEVIFIAQYESKAEYAVFNIEETSTGLNPLHGKIELLPSGFWSYKVYEQTGPHNLDPNNAHGIVEVGKVQVLDTPYTDSIYTQQSATNEVYINGK
jgi:hypothetical protein